MKILMVADFPRSPSDIRGGTWAAAYHLVAALLQYTDASVTTVSFRRDLAREEHISLHAGRLDVRQYPLGRFRSLINHVGQRREFRRVIRETNPDVVHAQGEGFYASLAVQSGLPNVYTIHGIRLKELFMARAELGFVRYSLRKREIEAHHRKATNIITIDEYTRSAINGLHRARVWTIPNAVRQDLFDIGAKRSSASSRGNVLLVGGVRRRKDILTALGTIRALHDRGHTVTLDIVGPGDDPAYLAAVHQFVGVHGLSAHVTIHGLIDDDCVRERYARADVLLLTSVEESSPICLVEAMAAGLPIVATNVGGIGKMVLDNAILCPSGDVKGIADALARVLSDAAARRRMSAISSEIARSKWSAETVARATYSAYEEIIRAG
jgi:glycosyltransferase involved in cell wall biosynthesis